MFCFKRLLLLQHDCHVCIFHAMLFPLCLSLSRALSLSPPLYLSLSSCLALCHCAVIAAAVPTVNTSSDVTFSPFPPVLMVLVVVLVVLVVLVFMLWLIVVLLMLLLLLHAVLLLVDPEVIQALLSRERIFLRALRRIS